MPDPAEQPHSYEEYLEIERSTGEKHEYIDGHVLAMAGGTPAHAELVLSVGALLKFALRGRPCRAAGC